MKQSDDIFENFGMMIPTHTIPRKENKNYTTIDELMKDAEHKYRWCDAGLCACLGCVNNFVTTHGFTKKDYDEWLIKNPNTEPEKDFETKLHEYKSFEIKK